MYWANSVGRILFILAIGLTCALASLEAASEARIFILPIPSSSIDLQKDHFTLRIVQNWISSKDSFFRKIVSKRKGMNVAFSYRISAATPIENTILFKLDKPGSNLNQPWGLNPIIAEQVPAQHGIRLSTKIVIPYDDNIVTVLNAAAGAVPGSDIFATPWVGYSKIVGNVISALFDAGGEQVPFHWDGDLKGNSGGNPGTIQEQYIVLIAAAADDDPWLGNLSATDLSYDDKKQQLLVDGQGGKKPLLDHSYAVLTLERAPGFKIDELAKKSEEPWATLARTQFFFAPPPSTPTAESVETYADNLYKQLQNEWELLVRTPRFSIYDQVKAFSTWADISIANVKRACRTAKIQDDACPTADLENIKKLIIGDAKLSPVLTDVLNKEVKALRALIAKE